MHKLKQNAYIAMQLITLYLYLWGKMCTVYSVLNVYLRTTMEAYYICSTHIANIDTIE